MSVYVQYQYNVAVDAWWKFSSNNPAWTLDGIVDFLNDPENIFYYDGGMQITDTNLAELQYNLTLLEGAGWDYTGW